MLSVRRRSYVVASASIFAALYALLGTYPLSKLALGSGFLSASKVIAPLGGSLFGPLVGGLASALGNLIDFAYLGQFGTSQVSTLVADAAVTATAGLAFMGRRALAVGFLVALIVWYDIDPLAVVWVGGVPFAWLHMISAGLLAVVLIAERAGRLGRLNPIFLFAVNLGALMAGQIAGTISGMNLLVRFGTLLPAAWASGLANAVFVAYPVERLFFAVVGTAVSLPVLLALDRRLRKT